MSLERFSSWSNWKEIVQDAVHVEGDACILHYFTHLMHAAEVLAYKHPDERFRRHWLHLYQEMVGKLHLRIEIEEELDARLADFDRHVWATPIEVSE